MLGRTLTLDGHAYDIVGVTPPGFFGVEVGRAFDVAVPLCAEPLTRGARIRAGPEGRLVPRRDRPAEAGLVDRAGDRAARRDFGADVPGDAAQLPARGCEDIPGQSGSAPFPPATGVSSLREDYESPLWLLLATTGLVLLIACANLANLMLARATAREREIAVRLAIGASRIRIVRQLLAESLLIAAAGAAAGAVLAQSLSRVLVASLTTQSEPRVHGRRRRLARVRVRRRCSPRRTCVVFGLMPAIRATATSPGAAMKAGSRGSTDSRERFGLRRALVVAQVALSLVLVVGALLFVRSFRNLTTLDAGFTRQQVFVATLDFRRSGVPEERLRASTAELLDRLRRTPGVESAAQVRNVPIGGSFSNRNIVIDGVARTENVNYNSISDRYFSTMGTTLLAGRDFDRRDSATAPRVAIVTESFARVFFNGANPIGRTFQIDEVPGKPRPAYEIVGFARDSKYNDLRDPFAAADLRAGRPRTRWPRPRPAWWCGRARPRPSWPRR